MKLLLPVVAFVTWAIPAVAEVCPDPVCDGDCWGRTTEVAGASPSPSPTPAEPVTAELGESALPEPIESSTPAPTPSCNVGEAVYVPGLPDVIGTTQYEDRTKIKNQCPGSGSLCTMSKSVDEFATGESLKAAINGDMRITCYVKGYELNGLPMKMTFQITDSDTMMRNGELTGLSLEVVGEENVPSMYGMSYVVVKNGNGHNAYRFSREGSTDYENFVGIFGSFPGPEMHAISHVSVCVAPCDPAKVESDATPIEALANSLQPTPSPTPLPEGATKPPVSLTQTEELSCPTMQLNNYTLADADKFTCGAHSSFCTVGGERSSFGEPSNFGSTGTVTAVTCTLSDGSSVKIDVTTTKQGYSYKLDIQDGYLITSALAKSATGKHGFYEWTNVETGSEGGTDSANVGTPIAPFKKHEYHQHEVSHLKVCVAVASAVC